MKISNIYGLIDSDMSIVDSIDSKNIDEIKKMRKYINENDKKDIIFELYNNKLLTTYHLKNIMNYCNKYLYISSKLIKILMNKDETDLLNIIFSYFSFFDNEFVLKLLYYYKYKKALSTSNLNQ